MMILIRIIIICAGMVVGWKLREKLTHREK